MDEAIKRILNVFSILQRAKTAILRGKTMHFGGSVATNLKCVFLAHCDVKQTNGDDILGRKIAYFEACNDKSKACL